MGNDTATTDWSKTAWACAEDNPWTSWLPKSPAGDDALLSRLRRIDPRYDPLTLDLADIDAGESARIAATGRMAFHLLGCSGDPADPKPQDAVAQAMAAQMGLPEPPSFLYHLGDIAYKDHDAAPGTPSPDWDALYKEEFYRAYGSYPREIFAVPGNHDGKYKEHQGAVDLARSGMWHFLSNFCDGVRRKATKNPDAPNDVSRATMTQPYPFWVLETPAACLIGLHTNICNGGSLDAPDAPPGSPGAVQYDWLVTRLTAIKASRGARAVLLLLHYPPLSAAADFPQRGDPQSPRTPKARPQRWLWDVLHQAFRDGGLWPDAVFSAHAHLYQRLTYVQGEGGLDERQIPFLIIGSGGHGPVEGMWRRCEGGGIEAPPLAPGTKVALPPALSLPAGDTVRLEQYNDQDFGFLRVGVDPASRRLLIEFFAAYPLSPSPNGAPRPCHDACLLDLDTHRLL